MKYLLFLSFFLSAPAFFGQTITLSEDFENGIPSTWTTAVVDTNVLDDSVLEYAPDGWIGIAEPDDTGNHVAASSSFFDYISQANRLLILPKLHMAGYGNILSWRARSEDPSYPDSYQVLVSTTDSLAPSFTDTIFFIVYEGEFWTDREVNLSDSGYVNQDIYVAINLNSINGYKLYVDDVEMRVQDPLSLAEASKSSVNVYPNPAAEFISVTASSPVSTVSVYDLSGKIAIAETTNSQKIDVSALNAGIYIVQIRTGSEMISKKLVKK